MNENENDRVRRAGEYLAAEYMARRPLNIMLQDFAPHSQTEAYAIQDAFQRRMAAVRGPVAGYKIAYTNAIMRERSGVTAPCSGRILSHGVLDSPASVQRDGFVRLGVECEVAVKLGADIPMSGAPYSREDISNSIEWLAVSFEVIDGAAVRRRRGTGTRAQGYRHQHQQRGRGPRPARARLAEHRPAPPLAAVW